MDRELKRGTLEMVLLKLLAEREMYGYEITTAVEERTRGQVGIKEGTLYPVLYRLEEAGLVEPRWQTKERGVPRKYYSVTKAGKKELERLTTEWMTFSSALSALMTSNGSRMRDATMHSIDEYVAAVLAQLPLEWPGRDKVMSDLRAHLESSVEAGATEEEAIARMGEPDLVAEELLQTAHTVLASPGRRLAAFVADVGLGVDILLALALVIEMAGLAGPNWTTQVSDAAVMAIMLVLGTGTLLSLAYFPALEATSGRTLGKKAFGIVVVRENGSRIGWKEAIIRRIPMFFQFILIDGLFIFFTRNHQRAFDKVAGTIVVLADQDQHVPRLGVIMIVIEIVIVPAAALLLAGALGFVLH